MKKLIKVSLVILVIFSFIVTKVFAEEMQDETQTFSEEDKINQLETQKKELESQTERSNSELQFVNEELSATIVEISELTQSMYDKQTEIEELSAKSEQLTMQIQETEVELEQATENYKNQKDLLEKRLVAMYEMGDTSYLDLLLNSEGISSFLSNYYYISEIATTYS